MRGVLGVLVRVGVLGVRLGVVLAVGCTSLGTVSTAVSTTSRMENTRRIH